MKPFSPGELYDYLKQVNTEICPLCGQRYKDVKETDFIREIGRCATCDKIQAEKYD